MNARQALLHPLAKWALAALLAVPAAMLFFKAFNNGLGANPAEALIRQSGDWTLRALCLALAITPLRVGLHQAWLARFRRMVGVNVFVYAVLHLLSYAWLDMGLDVTDIAQDIAKRPFILVGFVAILLLLAMAATSFNLAVRWLGAATWRAVHRSVYAVAGLAVLHFYWMRAGKQNFAEVLIYAAVLASLLLWRVWMRYSKRSPRI